MENFVDFSPATETAGRGTGNEDDRVVMFEYYGPTDLMTRQIAFDVACDGNESGHTSDNQVTRYVYAIELSDQAYHPVKDGGRVRAVIYPDSDDTVSDDGATPYGEELEDNGEYDRVELMYYADGSTLTRRDQRDVWHKFSYDNLGRLTADAAMNGLGQHIPDTGEIGGR